MRNIIFASILSALIFSANASIAAPSWLEGVFGQKESEEKGDKKQKKEKKHKKDKNDKDKSSKRKGPPDHAKAHGYRAKFKHYPDAEVYENTETGTFYGKKGGKWSPLDGIPSNIDLGNGVSIDLESAIPEVIRQFEK